MRRVGREPGVPLSGIFIALCALVYAVLSMALAMTGRRGGLNDRYRRWVSVVSGGLLVVAAGKLATD